MYTKPFYLTTKSSNNAFNFEKRPQPPKLFVPALKEGTVEDVKISQQVIFEEFDDNGQLHSCLGLENFIRTTLGGKPSYIFDNHNHAFFFWCLEKQKGSIQDGALLIHIDQHKDNRLPDSYLTVEESRDLSKVFTYTNTILNVGNFIPPAQKIGLIKDIIFLDSEYSLKNLNCATLPPNNIILDIDLDFFCPDMDYIGNDLKLAVIKKLSPLANIITFATSPYFIDQERAIRYLQQIAQQAQD